MNEVLSQLASLSRNVATPFDDANVPLSQRVADGLWAAYAKAGLKAGDLAPSVREIREHVGVSINVVQGAVQVLRRKGFVEPRRRRGCLLLQNPGEEPQRVTRLVDVALDFKLSNAYMSRYAQRIIQAGHRRGFHFYVYDSEQHGTIEAQTHALSAALSGRFCAAVLWCPDPMRYLTDIFARLRQQRVPVVFLENLPHGLSDNWDVIVPDGTRGGTLMGEKLVEFGHEQVGYIGPLTNHSGDVQERLRGLRAGLARGNVQLPDSQCFHLGVNGPRPEFTPRIKDWLDSFRPTAISLFTDAYFPVVDQILRASHWAAERRVSVVGYDAAPVEDAGIEGLTTIDPRHGELAEKLVEILERRLCGDWDGPFRHVITPAFVRGQTLLKP